MNIASKFTWIPLYKELSDWLLGKQNSQPELISTLKEIGISGFRDGSEGGKEIVLEEIDPFTFFSYLNKFHSDERRVEILQDLRRKLNFSCPEPTDVSGIPTTHPMKVHLFPWKAWLFFTTKSHELVAFKDVAGEPGNYTFLNDPEACPWAIYHWFKEYAEMDE